MPMAPSILSPTQASAPWNVNACAVSAGQSLCHEASGAAAAHVPAHFAMKHHLIQRQDLNLLTLLALRVLLPMRHSK